MIEIGAGGGSIARVGGTGLLKVGPDSSGADPGPVCYGQGGREPTVTDADLLLGYLDPGYFLGGDMRLDLEGAERAVRALGVKCGLDLAATAAGIAQVVNQNMATAIRIHAAERGKDYRRYALFAFGGAGPVHAYEIARILRLARVICPPGAGTNSAFGLLAAPVAIDLSRSYNLALAAIDWQRLDALYGEMEAEARRMLADAGIEDPTIVRTADVRFVGQGFELAASVPSGTLNGESAARIVASFHDAYRAVYASLPGELPVEALTWRVRASGPEPKIAVERAPHAGGDARRGSRRAYFPEARAYVDTPVYDRYRLAPGASFPGPAIVEERESTAVIGPSAAASIDDDLNLVIELDAAAAHGD
jgi:N-methylhydantoinase A